MLFILFLILFLLYFKVEHFNYLADENKMDWRVLNMQTKSYPRSHLLNPTAFSKTILHNMYWDKEYDKTRIRNVRDWDLQNPYKTKGCVIID